MRTPQEEPAGDEMVEPTVSTAPTSGTTSAPPASRWWHWHALPDHLGRARTSTVILSVLFLAVFTLYLNVRPDVQPTGTTPARGGSDVEAPVVPGVPTEPEPTTEPAPTTAPDDVEEGTESPSTTPSTSPSTSPSSTAPSEPTRETSSPAEPTRTSEPTGGTQEPDSPDATSSGAP